MQRVESQRCNQKIDLAKVKVDNLFKTASRNRMNLETENKYMYVHFNMPPLESWDPRETLETWLNEKNRREHSELIHKTTA